MDCNYQYGAGVEEFLSLIHYAEIVITNSLHGTIFSVILQKHFLVFPRIHGDKKIDKFLTLLNLEDRKVVDTEQEIPWQQQIDYKSVMSLLENYREKSIHYLKYISELL